MLFYGPRVRNQKNVRTERYECSYEKLQCPIRPILGQESELNHHKKVSAVNVTVKIIEG